MAPGTFVVAWIVAVPPRLTVAGAVMLTWIACCAGAVSTGTGVSVGSGDGVWNGVAVGVVTDLPGVPDELARGDAVFAGAGVGVPVGGVGVAVAFGPKPPGGGVAGPPPPPGGGVAVKKPG